MKKRKVNFQFSIFNFQLLIVLAGGCINQHPDDGGVDPTLVNVRTTVTLDVDYAAMTAGENRSTAVGTTRAISRGDEPWQWRVIVDAYRRGERERVSRQVTTVPDSTTGDGQIVFPLDLRLHALDYTLVAWCDRVPAGTTDDALYNTTDARAVACAEPYPGGSPERECARGTTRLDLTAYRDEWNARVPLDLAMASPLARWRLVATDVRRFMEKTAADRAAGRTYSARFTYAFYLPAGVDAMTGMPGHSLTGVTFTLPLDLPADGSREMEIGSDHVFAGEDASFVSLTIEVVDDTGKVVSRLRGLEIPYRLGFLTTARGAFLTPEMEGGVNIDTDYKGDIEIDLDQFKV